MALSKRLRFEIFKRDGFVCQYCGNRPPDVVLEVDHIHPRASGGGDDDLNLITSCFDCNRGKSAKVLGDRIIKPDADIKYLEAAQELAEARRFLEAKEQIDIARSKVIRAIQNHWDHVVDSDGSVPQDRVIHHWLTKYSPEEVVSAIDCAAPTFFRQPSRFPFFGDYLSYISGILRNRRAEEDHGR